MENNELFTERKNFLDGLIKLFKNENFNTENGKVISIDGEWGVGKTFFKDNFKEELKNNNFVVLEYNAWEHDYNEDPLLSIIGTIVSQMNFYDKTKKLKKVIENVKRKGFNLIKDLMPTLVVGLIKHYGLEEGYKYFQEISDGSEIITNHLIDTVLDYNRKEQIVTDFQKALYNFKEECSKINSLDNDFVKKEEKIIILIDDLDRCRPDYAIKVLERIKHFFTTKDYVFVFFNKKGQIIESINLIYGMKNGSNYLEKFYDLELNLPDPDVEKFLELLIKKNVYSSNKYDDFEKMMFEVFRCYFIVSELPLRIIEKSFMYYKTIIDTKPDFKTVYQIMYFPYMFFYKIIDNNDYIRWLKLRATPNLKSNSSNGEHIISKISIKPEKIFEIYSFSECEIDSRNIEIVSFLDRVRYFRENLIENSAVGVVSCNKRTFKFHFGDKKNSRISYLSDFFYVKEEEKEFIYNLLEMFDFKSD